MCLCAYTNISGDVLSLDVLCFEMCTDACIVLQTTNSVIKLEKLLCVHTYVNCSMKIYNSLFEVGIWLALNNTIQFESTADDRRSTTVDCRLQTHSGSCHFVELCLYINVFHCIFIRAQA